MSTARLDGGSSDGSCSRSVVFRRALVAGALGTLGGLVTAALARPLPVDATAQRIRLLNDENGVTVISAESRHAATPSSGTGIAIRGASTSGVGVVGRSLFDNGVNGNSISSVGVLGTSGEGPDAGSTGVMGVSGLSSLAPRANTGVYGLAQA